MELLDVDTGAARRDVIDLLGTRDLWAAAGLCILRRTEFTLVYAVLAADRDKFRAWLELELQRPELVREYDAAVGAVLLMALPRNMGG
jgi:hypothetical protein